MINVNEFDYDIVKRAVNHAKTIRTNKKITYYEIVTSFDIETTSSIQNGQKFAFMYIWQFAFENVVVYGRTWEEYKQFVDKLAEILRLNDRRRLVVYVHNLGYEFQFMRKYFKWADDGIFAVDTREPIKALTVDGIEYKDSYILAGLNLDHVAKNLHHHKIEKLVGNLDYTQIRTYKTHLTDAELAYCANDVKIVVAYIHEQIDEYGDITKIPLTNTGRVRQYTMQQVYFKGQKQHRKTGGQYKKYRDLMETLTLSPDEYRQLKRAFQGGFTHANANKQGQVIDNVTSYDFTSSYPTVMVTEEFPMGRGLHPTIKNRKDFDFYREHYCLVFDIKFKNLSPKITQEHYLSSSKCECSKDMVEDNGRIFSASTVETTITNVDYEIIERAYRWDGAKISNVTAYHKGFLPKELIKAIIHLYKNKTKLKGVPEERPEYMRSKGMLNSMYGMSVTNIVHEENNYINDEWKQEEPDLKEEIAKYNTNKKRFLFYPWGVFVTAYARRNLWTGIISAGDDYCYSDTDSIKMENGEKHLPYIKRYNREVKSKVEAICKKYNLDTSDFEPLTIKGKKKPIGYWDSEGVYNKFKTLGAKRYLVYQNGKLMLTCAGLSKSKGVDFLMKEGNNDINQAFKIFNDEMTVPAEYTGKLTHTYIDEPVQALVTDIDGNRVEVNPLSGIHLAPTEFTLSISKLYNQFLLALIHGEMLIKDVQKRWLNTSIIVWPTLRKRKRHITSFSGNGQTVKPTQF